MQVEAIYDQGKLEFLKPVRFVHQRFPVRVDIAPYDMAQTELSDVANNEALFSAYHLTPQSLGIAVQWWEGLLSPDSDWVDHDESERLTEKQNQYWDAFEFRARFYAEQGKSL